MHALKSINCMLYMRFKSLKYANNRYAFNSSMYFKKCSVIRLPNKNTTKGEKIQN